MEYFIAANSFAAPFFSDSSTAYREADTPEFALEGFAADYAHPAGLYSACAYESADAYHKGDKPLARWLSNHELAKQEATKDLGSYSYLGHGPGRFEVDHQLIEVDDPTSGRVVS